MEKIKSLAKEYKLSLIFISGGLILLLLGSFLPIEQLIQGPKSSQHQFILVDIAGQVGNPGVYKLKVGLTVGEAIRAAGGLLHTADPNYLSKSINLAQVIKEGQKIYIPSLEEVTAKSEEGSNSVNINSATSAELESLPGIGEVTAKKIIDGRPYGSIDELLTRKVVGKSTFEKIREELIAN